MRIRCWGSRGQIPVSGPLYNKYGGDTTCIEVRSESGDILIIDAGSGIRMLGTKLLKQNVGSVNILFTHLHLDHIIGLPYFNPLYKSNFKINIYGCPFELPSFEDALHGMMSSPYFPVDIRNVPSKIKYKDISTRAFWIGSIKISPILLNHPNGGLGFKLQENENTFIFLTDNELGIDLPGSRPTEYYIDFCQSADLLIHDAEFDKNEYAKFKAWGHSNFTEAVKLGINARVKRLGLFHINNRRTDRQLDTMVREAKRVIERNGSFLECFAVGDKFETNIL